MLNPENPLLLIGVLLGSFLFFSWFFHVIGEHTRNTRDYTTPMCQVTR